MKKKFFGLIPARGGSKCIPKKNIIDLVSPNINDELDRWIPFNINYKRFDINNFDNNEFF